VKHPETALNAWQKHYKRRHSEPKVSK
jgi:hypothetical protein